MVNAPKRRPRVLMIDDDPVFRKVLEVTFGKLGFEVSQTGSVQEFWTLSRSSPSRLPPDLVVVDLDLGSEGSGFDLISGWHRKDPKGSTPVVVLSGNADMQSMSHALEIGAADYILKTTDREHLASKLSRYVHSAPIDEITHHFLEVPEGSSPAKLSFTSNIVAIDEVGITLSSPHLISKGTVIKLAPDFFLLHLGIPECSPLVTVSNTWAILGSANYGIYAHFESDDTTLLTKVRQWLNTHPSIPTSNQ